MLSSLNYIEDLESLSFTRCILDGNIISCYGSMLFAFFVKAVFVLVPNLPLAFSIIGGVSVFLLIIFMLKMINAPLLSLEGGLIAVLIFFNPLIWIMSNRYAPDMLGTAFLTGAVYFFLADTGNTKFQSIAWLLTGLLAGVKSYYLIILIIPAIYALLKGRKYFTLLFIFIGLATWVLPALLNGREFAEVLGYQFSINTDMMNNIRDIIKNIWVYGLGGYWPQRNLFLILSSLGLLVCLFFGTLILLDYGLNKAKLSALSLGFCLYLSVFCFSDLGNEYNPLLPLIPFFCILISYGILYFIVNFNHVAVKVCVLIFLLSNITLTIAQVAEHKQLSAMAQAQEYIEEHLNQEKNLLIISDAETEFYLSGEIKASYLRKLPAAFPVSTLVSIGQPIKGRIVKNHISFHHDQFVSRFRPVVDLYEY
jgi:hypothetical protein